MKKNKLNSYNFFEIKPLKLKYIVHIFVVIFVFGFSQNLFAQDAEIEKKAYKPNTKSTKKPSTSKKKKVSTKNQTTVAKTSGKNSSSEKPRKKSSSKQKKNSILVKFNTPEPKQEIWSGDEILGTTNENAVLETLLETGAYLLTVKDTTGKVIIKSTLVNISTKVKDFNLVKNESDEDEITKPIAEESLKVQDKESIDETEKINNILASYGDPKKTNTITIADWDFIYTKYQANDLKNFTAIQIEAQRWFSSGQIEFSKGNFASAVKAFEKAIEYMPGSPYPFYAIGETQLANKQLAEALKAFQNAVQIKPDFALAHRKIGDINQQLNKPKESSVSYELAISNGFDTPAIRFDLAKSYMNSKRFAEASKELELVAKEAPSGDVFLTLGDLYSELKRKISAYEAYKKATELSPNSAIAFLKLSEILYSEREYETAKIAAEKALSINGKGKEIDISQAMKIVREASEKMK